MDARKRINSILITFFQLPYQVFTSRIKNYQIFLCSILHRGQPNVIGYAL